MILRKLLSGITWLVLVFVCWVFMPVFLAIAVSVSSDGLLDAIGDNRRENSAAFIGFLILVAVSQFSWWVILLH